MKCIPNSRRDFLTTLAGVAAIPALAQTPRDYSGQTPARYPDADIIALDKSFKAKVGNTPIRRVQTGSLWSEGPAWNGTGHYLVWSDIPNNRQMRWLEEDDHVSIFRKPANYSNGNTFDYQGRQLSCEHDTRRVTRFEPDGSVTVIADKFNGKPFNAPNDIVVHPDGGIWFTDPGYGILGNYEGHKADMQLKEAVYRVDPKSAKIELVADDLFKPNGLCFSPDYKKLYVCDTGSTHYAQAANIVQVYDVVDAKKTAKGKKFISTELKGNTIGLTDGSGLADGIRADKEGNIWAGMGWVGAGYDGVHVFSPAGQRIGIILLPEICANLCFGGEKRNRLFMAAGQSLYTVYVETQGAHIC